MASVEDKPRCRWVTDEQLARYHDEEWGRPPQSDAGWFEFVVLETFQAGLSWRTVLHKREAFRRAFASFEPGAVARFTDDDVRRLLSDPGIIRNRKKIEAAVENARIALQLVETHGSLAAFFHGLASCPDPLRVLQETFRFVGRTTAESIAFATGLLAPPHDPGCWKAYTEQARAGGAQGSEAGTASV
ncbi:MAG: DNA-3-methyladenine glycosylase I [Alicyclobacillus macrosporangiidus]|uniref:DNA-3-methyladenine glycosylase I n=1 Tax=Alicyclobacillus macrosporangiidus TaxID=392015 RepID=UPI0026F068F0|nr:DNA-3-methyladenine glycosylase I [Alicyclobacillus macrosporangiidus]MCL6598301.1 DNA-3-methyladenine glycosylase I [Alicyclobacillus macrosporangiidus]